MARTFTRADHHESMSHLSRPEPGSAAHLEASPAQQGRAHAIRALHRCSADISRLEITREEYEAWRRDHPGAPSCAAILHAFGTWHRALSLAGTAVSDPRAAACIAALRRWAASLGSESNRTSSGYAAWSGAQPSAPSLPVLRAVLGPWPDALRAAGVEVGQRFRARTSPSTDAQLRQGVLDYAATCPAGAALSSTAYDQWAKENRRACRDTVVARLGPWRDLLGSMGLEATRQGRPKAGPGARPKTIRYTDDQLRQILREYAASLPATRAVSARGYVRWAVRYGKPAVGTVSQRLGAGSWIEAVASAGLVPAGSERAPLGYQRFSLQEHAQALRACAADLGTPTISFRAYEAWRQEPGREPAPTAASIKSRAGSWSKAVAAALAPQAQADLQMAS